jgi:hypothetical protein
MYLLVFEYLHSEILLRVIFSWNNCKVNILVFRIFDYDDKIVGKKLQLLSLACLSDRHEYCIHRFAGGTGCQCKYHFES